MIQLRCNSENIIRVGVLLTKQTKLTDPLNPIYGAQLGWYYWRYLIKPDGTVIDIINFDWVDIPNCAGCYFLTLPDSVCNVLGTMVLYIYDAGSLGKPIFQEFEVVCQNYYDSKCGSDLLSVEQFAQKG